MSRSGRSSGGRSSGGSSGRTRTIGRPFGSSPSSSSSGGGSPITISGGTPFAGRTFGGASRAGIFAGAGFGGGYAAYHGYNNVNGRDFGYGYWPLYWYDGYYGNDEYGPRDNSSRPGGVLTSLYFNPSNSNSSAPPQYALFGDTDSVYDLNTTLVDRCEAIPLPLGGTDSLLNPAPNTSRVIEYYRESSFALLSYFVNSESAPDEAPGNQSGLVYTGVGRETENSTFYLYPLELLDHSFQSCVNETIGENLLIVTGDNSGNDEITNADDVLDNVGGVQPNIEYNWVITLAPLLLAVYITFFGRRFL